MLGKTLAHFQILDLLGKGGMGEVYRARDTKLGREVALKILPKEMSGDAERAARFEREARTLASLQHANVASIYGFEEADNVRFLIMELVEGKDLSVRLAAGKPPLDEARRIALQIASGLEAAHEKGIVHRDLKPANVMLTPDGDVKILDFGLARAWFGDVEDADLATSPTITAAMTQAGTILGTAAYMSPEQARGKNVDRRADIWAFGAILWELVTGKQLFEGETISDTLAAVLRAEPDWDELPADDEPLLCRLIERCLVRDPRERLRDIGEARILLGDAGSLKSHLSVVGVPVAMDGPVERPRRWPALVLAGLVGILLGGVLGWRLLSSSTPTPDLHLMIPPPAGVAFETSDAAPGPAVLSPDQRMVAFAGQDEEGTTRIYLRHLDQPDAVVLPGTETAVYPFWSADSRAVAFFTNTGTDAKLKKVAVSGGPPVTLCSASNGKGGTWNGDGVIPFAPDHSSGLFRVASTGGDPEPVTEIPEGTNSHRHPRFLPGGDRFLYLARTTTGTGEIWLGSLDGAVSPRKLTESEAQAEYSAGNLLTVQDGVLMASAFDPVSGELTPGRTPLVDGVMRFSTGSASSAFLASYSPSPSGMLVYQTGLSSGEREVRIVGLDGQGSQVLGEPGQVYHPKASPDGTRAIVEVGVEGGSHDLWMVDLTSGLRSRFSFSEADETRPVWTPDSAAVVYLEQQEDLYRVILQPVEGTGGTEVLYESEVACAVTSIHPDGTRMLLNVATDADAGADLHELLLGGEGTTRPIVVAPGIDVEGVYSPDGRWIAYFGVSTTGWDVYVIPVDGGRRKWQISTGGRVYPKWNADGTQIVAQAFAGTLHAYEVDGSGDTFRVGATSELVTVPIPSQEGASWSLLPDGARVVVAMPIETGESLESLIQLVTDWPTMLRR